MHSKTTKAINRIQELQQAFAQNLSLRINELGQTIQPLNAQLPASATSNQQNIKNTHDLAHKLAGSAGTFQFNDVYHFAKDLENFCAKLLNTNSPNTENWLTQINDFFKAIKGTLKNDNKPFSNSLPLTESNYPAPHEAVNTNKIILVDDDELLSALIQAQAKHFGYQIDCLTNPEELSEFLDKNTPEVILMDIVFPHYDFTGVDLVQDLKAKNKIHCPVIFLSNREDFSARLDAVRAGGNGYIVKPVNILELVEILDRHTQNRTDNGYRALIIDDDPIICSYYATLLEPHNVTSEIVTNPLNATETLSSFHPDIILLDVHMPHCNGFELAEVIRQDNRYTHIPILFLTTSADQQHKHKFFKVGADSFLDKNSSPESLVSSIICHSQRSKELHNVITRLRQDQLRFQAVSHSSTDAIITLNTQGLITLWNEGAENIFGYSSLEVIGQSIEIIIPEKYQEKHRKGFHNLVSDKGKLSKNSIESQAITKDQTLISIELTYTEWLSGHERFFTSIIRDTSNRKAIERKLKNKQENLNAIITNSAEGIITINAHGIIEMANPKAQKIFAYTEDELKGQNISILMPKAMRKQHDQYIEHSAIHAKKIINQAREIEGLRKDGSSFPMELNVSPMKIDGIKKYVGILHDITDRKIALECITKAKQDAEKANQAKSQFLSSMSHELRTPLNAILGFTQLLQEDSNQPVSVDQKESLSYIFSAGQHLLTLINEILDLSKIESGQVDINFESLDVTSAIDHALNLIAPQANHAQIEIISNLPTQSPLFVTADTSRLNQVLTNLLSNAVKYNRPQGKIIIQLSEAQQRVRISVTDTGMGIPKEMLPDLFEPFNRLGAEQLDIEGTGIGLTITKMLVEMMRGSIGLENHIGEGCTFWVELEKSILEEQPMTHVAIENDPLHSASRQGKTINILYIEDNPANRMLMRKLLQRNAKFSYTEAVTGNDGINAALKTKPDIVLLDINLPDMTGFEVFQKLQEYPELKTKFIIVSANAMPQDIAQGKGLDIVGYVTKPINQAHLLELIDHALIS